MEDVVLDLLYIYSVFHIEKKKFMYRGRLFRWSVQGSHVCITRYDEVNGTLRMTFWHYETPLTLWPKLNGYMQAQ
jgi:hypothetical protein